MEKYSVKPAKKQSTFPVTKEDNGKNFNGKDFLKTVKKVEVLHIKGYKAAF